MGTDAVALLRPRKKAHLRKRPSALVPREEGSVLFLTGMRYDELEADPASARAFLESDLGCSLGEVAETTPRCRTPNPKCAR